MIRAPYVLASEAWESIRLKYIASVNPSKSEVRNLSNEAEVTFLPMEAVSESWDIDYSQTRPLEELRGGYTYFRDGDILIAKITPCFENGKGALVKGCKNGIGFGSTEFHVIRTRNSTATRFLSYVVRSHRFKFEGAGMMTGTAGQKRLSEDYIKDFKVLFPPLESQEKIASFLDRKTAAIAILIEKKQRLIQLLEEKRTALINQAVTKGLNPNAPMKDSSVPWIGEIPQHWKVLKLGLFAEVTKLTGFEYTNHWAVDPSGEIIALRGLNVKKGKLDLKNVERIGVDLSNKLFRSKLFSGDIVFPCTGTVGNGALIEEDNKYHINQNIAKITVRSSWHVSRRYLLYQLCSYGMKYQIDSFNSSSLQPVLLIGTIRNLAFVLPDSEEQLAIAEYINHQSQKLDRIILKLSAQVEKLLEYRQSLITAAVTGKIDVDQEVAA